MSSSVLKDHWTEKLERGAALVLLSVGVFAFLGMDVGLAGGDAFSNGFGAVFGGVYVGAAVGLVLSMAVVPLVFYLPLGYALPLVYVPTVVICLNLVDYFYEWPAAVREPESWVIVCGCGLNIGLAMLAHLVLPKVHQLYRWGNHCPVCDYDLTDNTSGVCPECGAAVARQKPPLLARSSTQG